MKLIINDVVKGERGSRNGLGAELRAIKTNGWMAARKIDALEKRVNELEVEIKQLNNDLDDAFETQDRLRKNDISGLKNLLTITYIFIVAGFIALIVGLAIKGFF